MTPAGASGRVLTPQWLTTAPEDPSAGLFLDLWRWNVRDRRPAGGRDTPTTRASRRRAKNVALRRLLARYLYCDPDAIVFGRSARGRPFIAQPQTPVDFNLSDSRDTADVAITRRGRVGVDIEYHRSIRDPMAVAQRWLPATWIDELAEIPKADQAAAFFFLWTRFEACQKAKGQGVFAPRTAEPRECFGAFLPAPECSGHVCSAGLDAVPDRRSWRFFDYPSHD